MKLVNYFQKLWKKDGVSQIVQIIVGSIISSMAVVWFYELGGFFSGGVTGLSQIIVRLLGKRGIVISTGIFIAGLNVPLFIFAWRSLSKRFAFYTLIAVLLQSSFVSLFEYLREHAGINPMNLPGIGDNTLLLAILGGLVAAIGSSLCLKTGGSNGGTDIIANYLLVKKNIPFSRYSFIMDATIILLAGFLFNIPTALYTIVRLIVYLLAINQIYNTYRTMRLEIITTKNEEVRTELLKQFHHGITMYKAIGGYTLEEKVVLVVLTSAYEVRSYIELVRRIDPKAFITVMAVTLVEGNFNKKTIV